MADLDGDGDLDVLTSVDNRSVGITGSWYENTDGVGTFGPIKFIFGPNPGSQPGAYDLDGDGALDILAGGSWYENTDGAGRFQPMLRRGGDATAGDIDGDGDLDILSLACSQRTCAIDWYESNPPEENDPLPGDADNDGEVAFTDFLILSANFGSTDAMRDDGDFTGDGSVTFEDFLILSANFGTKLQVGDFNRDGQTDTSDLDSLLAGIVRDSTEPRFDLTGDGLINKHDLDHLVREGLQTDYGDINLDGAIDFTDFLILSANFGEEAAGWADGDFDGNGITDVDDLRLLSISFVRELSATRMTLQQVNVLPSDGSPQTSKVSGGQLFFTAIDGTHGMEPWRTDGTVSGTYLLKDIQPGSDSSFPARLSNVNGTLFFTANDGDHGRELWKSDGTPAGTVMVKDTNPDGGIAVVNHAAVGDTFFFGTDGGVHGAELWKSDGTPEGTVQVMDIRPGPEGSNPQNLFSQNGTLFFTADDGTHGRELWKTDGTQSGTVLVRDIIPDDQSSELSIRGLAEADGTLFFDVGWTNSRFNVPTTIWKSDGTSLGTVPVKELGTRVIVQPMGAVDGRQVLYLSQAVDGRSEGLGLWSSDGTEGGTQKVIDLPDRPQQVAKFGEMILFMTDKFLLWKTDGTEAGTMIVKELTELFDKAELTDSQPYFVAMHGREIWTSDGTQAGTGKVVDGIEHGISNIHTLRAINGGLYFTAHEDSLDPSSNGMRKVWLASESSAHRDDN